MPTRKRKQPLRGIGAHVGAMCPIVPNALWALDSQFDVTVDGRTLKLLNVIDEFTHEAMAIVVDRSVYVDHVVRSSTDSPSSAAEAPGLVRFDNGPEFVAHAVADWCRFNHTDSVFIDPSSPWQNAWIESFNGRLRDELLNGRQWDSLLEARVIIEDWRIDYNLNRPHTAHGDLSPARVRRRVVHQPTPSRTATGPTIGSPSLCRGSYLLSMAKLMSSGDCQMNGGTGLA